MWESEEGKEGRGGKGEFRCVFKKGRDRREQEAMRIVSWRGTSVSVGAEGLCCPWGGFLVEAGCLLLKALVQSLVFSLHIEPVSIHTLDQQVFLSINTLVW